MSEMDQAFVTATELAKLREIIAAEREAYEQLVERLISEGSVYPEGIRQLAEMIRSHGDAAIEFLSRISALEAEVERLEMAFGNLRAAFRVNMLRHCVPPDGSTIDAEIARVLATIETTP